MIVFYFFFIFFYFFIVMILIDVENRTNQEKGSVLSVLLRGGENSMFFRFFYVFFVFLPVLGSVCSFSAESALESIKHNDNYVFL